MSILRRCLDRLTPFATATWLVMIIMFTYWKFLDNPVPVVVHNVSILHDGPIHSGDTVTLHVDVCQKYPGVAGSGVRMIKGPGAGGYTHLLSESYVDPFPECTLHDRHVTLPKLDAGEYYYIFQAEYQINPAKRVVFSQPPVTFKIVE